MFVCICEYILIFVYRAISTFTFVLLFMFIFVFIITCIHILGGLQGGLADVVRDMSQIEGSRRYVVVATSALKGISMRSICALYGIRH